MSETIDIRLACCVVNKKVLTKHIEKMTQHSKLKLISENNDSMKEQIEKLIEKYGCHIFATEDHGDISHVIIKRDA
jgi:TusA-related sulfurtransferase